MANLESIWIRPFADSDRQALRDVAQRDSSIVPAGMLLVAEMDGAVRAALSLDTGEVVADPFAPSAALVDLLRTRARQLTRSTARTGRLPGTRDVAGRLAVWPVRRRPAFPWTREPSPSD